MGFAEFAKVRCAGPAIALSLAVALAASLTLTPALLRLLGHGRASGRAAPARRACRERSAADARASGTGSAASSSPGRCCLVASPSLLLLPLALLGLQRQADLPADRRAVADASSVRGPGRDPAALHRRRDRAGDGAARVGHATGTRPRAGAVVAHLSRGFARLDNVAEVRSLTQPLGKPLPRPAAPAASRAKACSARCSAPVPRSCSSVSDQRAKATATFYVADRSGDGGEPRYVTRLDVVLTDPFDPQSVATLELIQTWLRRAAAASWPTRSGGVQAECYGVTVSARDLAQVTESDRPRVNVLVLAGIFLILLVLVRRPWLAATCW